MGARRQRLTLSSIIRVASILILLCALLLPAQSCDWTGAYDTNNGRMVFQQSGDAVKGWSDPNQDLLVQGKVNGDTLSGSLTLVAGSGGGWYGTIQLMMSNDCRSFSGFWTLGKEQDPDFRSGSFSGNRNSASSVFADLTGVWNCDYGGKFYITQIGNSIWWFGQSLNPGQWANVAKGSIDGDTINLEWADVPLGNAKNHGTLVLNIASNEKLIATERTGGFAVSTLTR